MYRIYSLRLCINFRARPVAARVKLAAGGQPPTAAKNINKLKQFWILFLWITYVSMNNICLCFYD